MYICLTYVDAVTGIPCTVAPMCHGPKFPEIKNWEYKWANENQWPTDRPLFYGTCADDADVDIPGVIAVLSDTEYQQLWDAEWGPIVVKNRIVVATQQKLDLFAQTRNYDNILSLCTYATSANPKFAAEGQYGIQARDTTWSKLYEILAEVESGTRPMPKHFLDIQSDLPILKWPDEVVNESTTDPITQPVGAASIADLQVKTRSRKTK